MRPALTLLAAFALLTPISGQQPPSQPQTTFRSGVDLVQVEVSVLDKDRKPVPGLTAADFTIREDGKVRPVSAFTAVTLPPPAPPPSAEWMREVAPDVTTNTIPRGGRLVVIVMDHSIPNEAMVEARRTAEAAVDQLGPADLAAVLVPPSGMPQGFTADRALLKAAIRRPFLGISAAPGVFVPAATTTAGFPPLPSQLDADPSSQRGECRCGICSLEAMTLAADAMRDVTHRRKSILFIGSGVPVMSIDIECSADIKQARTELLRAAGAANVAIHTFDASLLLTGGESASRRDPPSTSPAASEGRLRRQLDLAYFPAETGGRTIKNTNAPWQPMPDVFAESASYYVLGFEPSSRAADGRHHDIEVRVARPGLAVHSRNGYNAPRPASPSPQTAGAPPPGLVSAIASIWPANDIPLSVAVAPIANPGHPEAAVAVVVRGRMSAASTDGPTAKGREVRVLAGAYDRDGKPLDTQVQTLLITPPPRSGAEFEYEVVSRLRLRPGRHEIRVALEEVARQVRASVYTYASVPDFAKAPLSLSGIVLGLRETAHGAAFADLLPITPTNRREFATIDHVRGFARVYQGGSDRLAPVTVTMRIVDAKSQQAGQAETRLFDDPAAARRAVDYGFELPLTSLPPGPYLLSIEAARAGKPPVREDVRFTVR